MLHPLDRDLGGLQRRRGPGRRRARDGTRLLDDLPGCPGRDYIRQALTGAPFLLYETPQAPHWVKVTRPDGSIVRRPCRSRSTRTRPSVHAQAHRRPIAATSPRTYGTRVETAQASQQMCASQLRAIMTADDQFGATMQLLADRGELEQHVGDLLLRQRLHVGRARPHREVRALRAVHPGAAAGSLAGSLPVRGQHARASCPTSTCCRRCCRPQV